MLSATMVIIRNAVNLVKNFVIVIDVELMLPRTWKRFEFFNQDSGLKARGHCTLLASNGIHVLSIEATLRHGVPSNQQLLQL